MFPIPAAARWSRRAAFTGARRRLSRAARLAGVNGRERGSSPRRTARDSASPPGRGGDEGPGLSAGSNNKLLPPPIDGCDALALQLGGDLERLDRPRDPRIADLDPVEAPADEHRLELSPNRLDLGELRHARSLARRGA